MTPWSSEGIFIASALSMFRCALSISLGNAPEPLIQRYIEELIRDECLEKDEIRVTCVFDVVRRIVGNITHIVGIEVIVDREKGSHGLRDRSSSWPFVV